MPSRKLMVPNPTPPTRLPKPKNAIFKIIARVAENWFRFSSGAVFVQTFNNGLDTLGENYTMDGFFLQVDLWVVDFWPVAFWQWPFDPESSLIPKHFLSKQSCAIAT